ncbi:MAG: OmpA family protein, partial [Deltaproteobacteria bacterium]|nr:OmpA family protein [Deltaproteobacteria bacterium]
MKTNMKVIPQIVLVFFLVWCCYTVPASLADQASVARWIASIESEDVLFGSAQQSLSATSREQLNMISAKLAQLYGHFIIEVTGHTDDSGDADENLRLSHMRALSVVEYLSQKNLHHHRFLVQSKGEFQPTVSNATEQGRMQNRRVEIRVVADGDAKIS